MIRVSARLRARSMAFLGCVAVAGIYGAATADKKILFVQTVPALAAIIAGLLSSPT